MEATELQAAFERLRTLQIEYQILREAGTLTIKDGKVYWEPVTA